MEQCINEEEYRCYPRHEDYPYDEYYHRHHHSHRYDRAESVVRNSMMWTGASGIIPIPIVDVAAIGAFQLNMLYRIGEIYDQRFSRNWGKSVIAALVGGYTSTVVGTSLAKTLLRSVPIIGGVVSIIAVPGFAAATTWALGQIFIMHFESGGTILDFDPLKVRDYYFDLVRGRLGYWDRVDYDEYYDREHHHRHHHHGHRHHHHTHDARRASEGGPTQDQPQAAKAPDQGSGKEPATKK